MNSYTNYLISERFEDDPQVKGRTQAASVLLSLVEK